ncbi:MAG: hypothetical protein MJA29_12920, partial [Candidatus Omnitrophica bacterium]|nr:hypothetical protein [Candidatus Omnitrophota bacterium]
PNEHAQETPFFLMYARDPYMDLEKIVKDETRYIGDNKCIPALQTLHKYQRIIAENLIRARAARDKDRKEYNAELPKVNDMILVKDHTAKSFEPKWITGYRAIKVEGKTVTAKDTVTGRTAKYFITDVKQTDLRDQLVEADKNVVHSNSRPCTLVIHKSKIPDLQMKEPQFKSPAEALQNKPSKAHPFEQVKDTVANRTRAKLNRILGLDLDIADILEDSTFLRAEMLNSNSYENPTQNARTPTSTTSPLNKTPRTKPWKIGWPLALAVHQWKKHHKDK